MHRIHPTLDGVTHVNCHSRGATPLGRALSNFARLAKPVCTTRGAFYSIEALWYHLQLSDSDDNPITSGSELEAAAWELLPTLSGSEAKHIGRSLFERCPPEHRLPKDEAFKSAVCAAVTEKLRREPLATLLAELDPTLPLTHYHIVRGQASHVTTDAWWLHHLEQTRAALRKEKA